MLVIRTPGALFTKLLNPILKLNKYFVCVEYYNIFIHLIKYLDLYLVYEKLRIQLSMLLSVLKTKYKIKYKF